MADEAELKIEKPSKDIGKLKEGDSFFINGKELKVDKQFLFQEHEKISSIPHSLLQPQATASNTLQGLARQILCPP